MQPAKFIAFAVPLILVVLSSCSGNPEGAEYFWNPNGSRRTYDVKMLIPRTTGILEGIAIFRGDGTCEINGLRYHKQVLTFDGIPGTEPDIHYVRLARDGIYSRKSNDPTSAENLEVPLPLEIGRKWLYIEDNFRVEYEIVAVEDLDTTEKTYKRCVKVAGNGTKDNHQITTVSYYAPQVGLVKMSMEGYGVLQDWKIRDE